MDGQRAAAVDADGQVAQLHSYRDKAVPRISQYAPPPRHTLSYNHPFVDPRFLAPHPSTQQRRTIYMSWTPPRRAAVTRFSSCICLMDVLTVAQPKYFVFAL
jgi:hypothetical protein